MTEGTSHDDAQIVSESMMKVIVQCYCRISHLLLSCGNGNLYLKLSNLFAIITSKKILFNSKASFVFILKLHNTIPPNALTGSQAKAD